VIRNSITTSRSLCQGKFFNPSSWSVGQKRPKSGNFAKKIRIYEGNISEPKTLENMIKGLFIRECGQDPLLMPMIVLDAGIASEDNIKLLRSKNYRYIVVSRKKKKAIPQSVNMMAVKRNDKGDVLVEAGLCNNPDTDEYEKVIERVGRLKERYRSVARGYKITVVKDPGKDKAKDKTDGED
jgi:hypothetical protein